MPKLEPKYCGDRVDERTAVISSEVIDPIFLFYSKLCNYNFVLSLIKYYLNT